MCLKPITRRFVDSAGHSRLITHPCGKCLECVQQLQNDWANRMCDEFKQWKHAYFGTFTYGNSCIPYVDVVPSDLPEDKFSYLCDAIQNIPISSSLVKARNRNDSFSDYLTPKSVYNKLSFRVPYVSKYDVQCFIKRVRIDYERKYEQPLDFKYFICSEYGPCTLRPHYHAIFFSNVCWERFAPFIYKHWYMGAVRGFHELELRNGTISDACAYVAKYCVKPSEFENPYVNAGLIPRPFRLMSKGIGSAERSAIVEASKSYTGPKRISKRDAKRFGIKSYYGYSAVYLDWLRLKLSRFSQDKGGQWHIVKQPRYYTDACFPKSIHYSRQWKLQKDATYQPVTVCTTRKNCDSLLCLAYTRFMEDRYLQLCNDKFSALKAEFPTLSDSEIIHKAEIERLQNVRERYKRRLSSFVKFYGKSFLNDM